MKQPFLNHDNTALELESLLARKKSRLEEMLRLYHQTAEVLKKPEGPFLEKLSETMQAVGKIREEINVLDEEISRKKGGPTDGLTAETSCKASSTAEKEIKALLGQIQKIHEHNLSLAKKIHQDIGDGLSGLHQGKKATAYLKREIAPGTGRLNGTF